MERVESVGIDRPGGTDTRTENVEKSPAEDQPPAPPPDRPGSPGQPSRLESLRAAREAQEARRTETGAPQTAPQETGAEQRDERDDERDKDRGESSSAGPADGGQDAQTGPMTPERAPGGETESDTEVGSGERGQETDRPESETGQALLDGRDEQPSTTDPGALAPEQGTEPRGEVQDEKAKPSSDGSANDRPDEPADPRTAEEQPMTGEAEPETDETGQPEGSNDEPPRQDTGEVGPESPGERVQPDDREAETEAAQDLGHQPLPQRDGGSETPQAAEAPVRASDNSEPEDAPAIRVGWLPAAEEGVTRWASPVVQFNEQMPGNQLERRDRNAEGRPGTPASTEDEPNKYRNLPNRITDLTPGRGELRKPEDDAENQDLREPDPDRTRRSERVRRRIGRETEDTIDVGQKLGNKIGSFLDDHPPGPLQTSTGRDVPNMTMPQHNVQLGNGAIGLAIGAIVLAKGGQRVYAAGRDKVSKLLGERHGSDG